MVKVDVLMLLVILMIGIIMLDLLFVMVWVVVGLVRVGILLGWLILLIVSDNLFLGRG